MADLAIANAIDNWIEDYHDPNDGTYYPIKIRMKQGEPCTCGGYYTKRVNSKTGQAFMGCSNFPKCKNTSPIGR